MAKTIDYLRELAATKLPQDVTPERYEAAKLLSALGWIDMKSKPDSGMRVNAITFAGQAVVHKSDQLQQAMRAADPPAQGFSALP